MISYTVLIKLKISLLNVIAPKVMVTNHKSIRLFKVGFQLKDLRVFLLHFSLD